MATHHAGAAGPAASPLQAVLFDMDGLLVDTEPLWLEVECDVMARLGGRWGEDDQKGLVGGSLELAVTVLRRRAALPASRADVARWLVDGMTSLLASRGVTMLPGARELLAEVRAAGVPHALVTSSERAIMDAVLEHAGLAFCAAVCGSDVRHRKPDPEPYLLASSLLGVSPRAAVALEDSPNGVASARAAGCQVLAVPSLLPVPPGPGRTVVASLAQVSLETLRRLADGGGRDRMGVTPGRAGQGCGPEGRRP